MRLFGIFLIVCTVLAALQALAAVLAVTLVGAIIYGLFAHPKETLGFLGLATILGVAQTQPLALVGLGALLLIAKIFRREG